MKNVFYHSYFFNTELILEYVIINMIIKVKRGESSRKEGVRKEILQQQLGECCSNNWGVIAAIKQCCSIN